ncbi:tetratricopeptide repeat protein [Rubripirellula sp.]|nr:tetratricopeptide repeat protein [Rubripirellula sp.]
MAENEPSPEIKSRRDKITIGLMGLTALVTAIGFGLLFSLWWQTSISDPYQVLQIASQEFVAGRPIVAGELAERVDFDHDLHELGQSELPGVDQENLSATELQEARDQHEEWMRLRDFLIGFGKVSKAQAASEPRQSREHLHEAISYLERAREGGFPPGRDAQGYRVLGESYYRLGEYEDAIESLRLAISQDPTLRRPLQPMLAEAQLKSLSPIEDQALATIERYLDDHTLLDQQRWKGELIRIGALIDLNRWGEANQILNDELSQAWPKMLDRRDPAAQYRDHLRLLQLVVPIKQAMLREGSYAIDSNDNRNPAVAELAEIIPQLAELENEAASQVASRARLWASRALLVQGRVQDALCRLTSVRQLRPFDAVAILGGLEEIELLAARGRGEEVLQTTTYIMREMVDDRGFDAELITFDEFQRRMGSALAELRNHREYEHAIDTARRLPPVFDAAEAFIQEGMSYREWAGVTLDDHRDNRGQVPNNISVLARTRFRAAGDAFAAAAELQFDTDEYLKTQWFAIEAYQNGRHFKKSIRLLKPYLRYEQRALQPRGLVSYGRALLAEDRPEEAIAALSSCIAEFPRDPMRYDARLLAALSHAELSELDDARRFLQDNLEDGELTPQSTAWRNSLLTMGELLYQRAYRNFLVADQAEQADKVPLLRENQPLLEEAIRYLDEGAERYFGEYKRAESAAYLAARANVMASYSPRLEAASTQLLGAARQRLRAKADQALQKALGGFIKLRAYLANREEDRPLERGEQAMLRNCHLAEGDVLRRMGRLDEAAEVYQAVELRYMNEPPALEAMLGRVAIAREQGKLREADLLIRQANLVLQRIPAEWDDQFVETTRYDREGWETYLGWMNDRLLAGT